MPITGGVTKRRRTTYEYDDRNRLNESTFDDGLPGTSDVHTSYGYDKNGNRTSKNVTGGNVSYEYDISNRLIQATVAATGVEFHAYYDARTRRIAKTESGDTTVYRYDGGTNFQELQGNDVVTELIRAGGLGGGIGSVLYSDKTMAPTPGAGEWEGFLYNAVGSTVMLHDSSGTPTQRNLYEAFGETIAQTGDSSNTRLRNTKERDESIGLDNDGFRYYDPATATYIQRDPLGYADGMNVYMSVHGNPVNKVDPVGLATPRFPDDEGVDHAAMAARQLQDTMARNYDEIASSKQPQSISPMSDGPSISATPGPGVSGYLQGIQAIGNNALMNIAEGVLNLPSRIINHIANPENDQRLFPQPDRGRLSLPRSELNYSAYPNSDTAVKYTTGLLQMGMAIAGGLRLGAEAAGPQVIGNVEPPPNAAFGTTRFGTAIERPIFDWLQQQYPGSQFGFRPSPRPGVDVTWSGRGLNPGFEHAEIKPNSLSGLNKFDQQTFNWGLNNVKPFTYDGAGNIYSGFGQPPASIGGPILGGTSLGASNEHGR